MTLTRLRKTEIGVALYKYYQKKEPGSKMSKEMAADILKNIGQVVQELPAQYGVTVDELRSLLKELYP
jgi:hypothetical protein